MKTHSQTTIDMHPSLTKSLAALICSFFVTSSVFAAKPVINLADEVDGNDGTPDTITARLNADDRDRLDIEINGRLVASPSVTGIEDLTINGSGDSDTLVIDATNGLPGVRIYYNAGLGEVDSLDLIALPKATGSSYVTAPPTSDGKSGLSSVSVGTVTLEVHFTGIEPLTFVGAGGTLTIDASATPATSTLMLSDVGAFNDGVNRITGDGGFEDTTFSGFDALIVRGGDGAETITVEDLDGADPDGGGPGAALTSITVDGDNVSNTDTAADTINLRALPASVTATIHGGGGSDIINLGSAGNSIGGLLGDIMIDGEGHAPGSTTLTIGFSSNTLDSGDILNINDTSDAGSFTYTLGATTLTRSGIGTITYGNIETFNLTTSLGFGAPTVVDVNNTAAGVNTNITTQNVTGQPSDINVTTTGADSNLIINTSTANDDINIVDTGGDGPDTGFLQGSFTRINTSGGNDIFTQQNAAQNSFLEINLEAGTDTANVHAARNAALTDINAGDNTDTLNWGNPSNTLTGYAGILQFDGGNHDAGSSSLTIKGETNTLDSGDIVNVNDQGETAETGYQFQEFGSSILAREGAGGLTYTNAETFNVNTTSGVANFIGFGSAPGININYTSQGANDTFLFFDGEGIGADVNFVINSGGGADSFDIDEGGGNGGAGNPSFGAFIQINASNDNDTLTIDDLAATDRFEFNGEAGDDTMNVTPTLGCINVTGGSPSSPSSPGDTLNLTDPPGETSTLVNQMAASGTYQTTGGFGDVVYDGIESGPPPFVMSDETEVTLVGGTLTVTDTNGGTSDDNLTVFLLGTDYQFTDNNGNTIDASSIPGSTGSGTNMVTVPAAGVTGIEVQTLGGDDTLLWLNVAAVDYSIGGILIDGGTGDDSMSFSASQPVTLNNADVTVTSTKEASLSGAGPFNLTNGNVTVNGNAAGTFPGIGNGASLGATVNITGTGDINVIGRGGQMGGQGVFFGGRVTLSGTGPTAGTITLDGQAGPGSQGSRGITLSNPNAFITSVDGDITITGVGTDNGDDNYGIEIDDIDRIESTGTGADAATITLHGTAGNGAFDNAGLRIFSGDITSALGDITLTGIGGTSDPTSFASAGLSVLRSTVQVDAGRLTASGTANGGIAAGVWMFEGEILSIGSGAVEITAAANALGPDMKSQNINNVIGGASSNSNVTIKADSIEWANLTLQSTGDLAIRPRTAGTTIGLGGGTGELNLDDTELGFLADGFNSITIGDTTAGTGTVDIDTVTFTDPITIAGGTINDGTGSDIAAATNPVTLTGNVSPGQSPGILVVSGNLTFGAGSTLEAEIMGTTPGVLLDQIDVTGTVDLNNATLNVDSTGFTATGTETFVLINNDSADAITGTFNGLPEGAAVTVGGETFAVSYVGGDGNDVALSAGDSISPTLLSFERENPATSPTNADSLTFRATFDEDVTGVDAADFEPNGTTATVTGVTMVSADVWDVTISGGDLAGLDGTVGLDLAAGQDIEDLAGNALPPGEPAIDETYQMDNQSPVFDGALKDIVFNVPTGGSAAADFSGITATDAIDGAVPVVCTPDDSAPFPIGTHPITCTATDSAGNMTTESFNVIVLEIALTPGSRFLDAVSLRGDAATGATGTINNITRAYLNNAGDVLFLASLSGAGTNNAAVFAGPVAGPHAAIAVLGTPSGSGTYGSFDHLTLNDAGDAGFESDRDHFVDTGGGPAVAADTGGTAPTGGGETFRLLKKPALASDGQLLTRANLDLGSGAGVTTADDTLITSSAGTVIAREGSATSIAGIDYSTIQPRTVTSLGNGHYAFAAGLKPSASATNAALFTGVLGSGTPAPAVRKGDPADGTGGGVFRSFLAESINSSGEIVLRGNATGAGISASNNEGLWSNAGNTAAPPVLIAREGDLAPCLPAPIAPLIAFDRFTTISIADDGSVCFFAYLKNATAAPAVNSTNDGSLWHWSAGGGLHLLAREGDPANNTDGAAIGRITGFACSGDGVVYQVEFVSGQGDTTNANRDGIYLDPGTPDAVPELVLRRGDSFELMGSTRTVASLKVSFEENVGHGTGGYGRSISSAGDILLNLSLSGNLSGIFVISPPVP